MSKVKGEKKSRKHLWRRALIIIACITAVLFVLKAYHQFMLPREAKLLVPTGQLVEVGGAMLHVHAEGVQGDKPAIVLMSGAGTVAPVYDFAPLTKLLAEDYRVIVIEKRGYGFSDISQRSRDIDTILSETREALSLAGEHGPFILIPHSMSGVEALYWAQCYPEEVEAIIGLDMAIPESYEHLPQATKNPLLAVGRVAFWFGLHRIPGIYPINTQGLMDSEAEMQRLLLYRNAGNEVFFMESDAVYASADKVEENPMPKTPMLLFSSNGKEIGAFWVPLQETFAQQNGCEFILLDCGHYLHS